MKKFFAVMTSILLLNSALYASLTAKIVDVKGGVQFKSPAAETWVNAKPGDLVKEADSIRTAKESSARIKLEDGTLLMVESNTLLTLEALKQQEVEVKKMFGKSEKVTGTSAKINLASGNIFSKVNKLSRGSEFEVKTAPSVCGVRGTSFNVEQIKDESNLSVLEGNVEMYNPAFPNKKVSVKKGEKTSLTKNSAPEKPKKMSDEELAKLNSKEKEISKPIIIELTPTLLGENIVDNGNIKEITLKVKNIDLAQSEVIIIVLSNGNPVGEYKMNFSSGGKEIEAEKVYIYSFDTKGEKGFSFKYKIVNK